MQTPQVATPEAHSALGLNHKVRLPQSASDPLVLFVHGRAGTLDVMWAFRRAVPDSFGIIAPQAPIPDPIGGFSWWLIDDELPTRAKAERAAPRLADFVERALSFYSLRPTHIIGCGFSQGAGMLSFLIQREPQLFAAVALLAGFVIPLEAASIEARVLMAHGTEDSTVPLATALEGKAFLESHGAAVEWVEDKVGHKIGPGGMRALTEFFKSFS